MNNLLLQANRSYFVLLSHILRPHNSANYSKQQKNLDLSVKNYLNLSNAELLTAVLDWQECQIFLVAM